MSNPITPLTTSQEQHEGHPLRVAVFVPPAMRSQVASWTKNVSEEQHGAKAAEAVTAIELGSGVLPTL